MGQPTAGLELQVGKEATNAWGTAVTPTAKLMAVNGFSITPLIDVRQLDDEIRGTLQPAYKDVVQRVGAEAILDGYLTYEDAPYLFDAMFHHSDTDNYLTTDASADGTWTYDAPTESSDIEDPRVMTYVYGDGTYVWGLNGGTARELSITAATGEPVMYSMGLFGKNATTDALASLSDRSVDVVMGDHALLWIDPGSDSVGTTAVSDIAFSAEITINSNRQPIYHLGDLTPTGYQDFKWDGTLSLMLELGSTAEAYLVDLMAVTTVGIEKNVRLKFLSDSDYIQMDFSGVVIDQPEIFEDDDGVITVSLNLASKNTSGMTSWFEGEIFNHVVSLT